MNVLHICNGYADSKVHSNLTKSLDDLGLMQTVYCPVREERFLGHNKFDGNNIKFVYSFCIKPWYKYVYQYKQWMLYKDMKNQIELDKFDIIHAPTLFSDGGLALKVYKKFGIPYVVAVRNTDINLFIKKLKHTHYIGREIALCAQKIFFISKAEKDEFLNSAFVAPILSQIEEKIVIQPNGVDNFWLQHISLEQRFGHKVLYIGNFSPNKNVDRLIKAILELRKSTKYSDLKLVIVGGGKEVNSSTRNMIDSYPNFIEYLGEIYDKKKLIEIMRQCALFAMPSIHETFGLVYIEALSQNLPVIYSKGQGIDGLLDRNIGERVNALSVDEIREAIYQILEKPYNYSNNNIDFTTFDWNMIAHNYKNYYEEIFNFSYHINNVSIGAKRL